MRDLRQYQASVRYMAAEPGPAGKRVHAISPGPVPTRAGSRIDRLGALMEAGAARAPRHALVTSEQIGNVAAFRASEASAGLTDNLVDVDNGYHVIG